MFLFPEIFLVSWCASKKNVIKKKKRRGYFDLSINAAIADLSGLNNFILELKSEFGDMIDSYETMVNAELIKLDYMPF